LTRQARHSLGDAATSRVAPRFVLLELTGKAECPLYNLHDRTGHFRKNRALNGKTPAKPGRMRNWREEKRILEFGTKRPRVRIPPLRLPEALIFLRFRVFCFWRKCRFFPVCNLPGCSVAVRHLAVNLKIPLP